MIESTVVPIPGWQSRTSHESICRAVYPPSLGTQSFYIEPLVLQLIMKRIRKQLKYQQVKSLTLLVFGRSWIFDHKTRLLNQIISKLDRSMIPQLLCYPGIISNHSESQYWSSGIHFPYQWYRSPIRR